MTLKEEDIRRVVDSHSKYSGNVKTAEENIPYSGPTIRRIWRLNNLPTLKKVNPEMKPKDEKELMIIGLHEEYHGNVYEASMNSNLEFSLIYSVWKRYKLPLMYKGITLLHHHIPLEKVYGLLYHYPFCEDVRDACIKANFEGDECYAIQILIKYNLISNDRKKGERINKGEYGTNLRKDEICRIAKELEYNRGNVDKVARRTGHTANLIKKVIECTGIVIDKKEGFIQIPEELRNPLLEDRV